MYNRELVIVGVDPGTTVGYAIVDLQGNILEVKSSKELSLNSLIERVTNKANPVVVATDKHKSPGFVEKFAVKVGARILHPSKDLLVEEKRLLIKNNHVKNSHEMDALASAFYACKMIEPLIIKIDNFINQNNKENISCELKKLVLSKKDINIKTAANLIEHPQDKEVKIIKKVIEEERFSRNDFFQLYEESQKLKKANSLLMQQNNNLKNNLNGMQKKYLALKKQVSKLVSEEKIQKYIEFKEERIQNLINLVRSKDDEINDINKELNNLREFLALNGEYAIIKKLDNLGWNEFIIRNKIIQLHKGDILFVNDPNIFSHKTLDFIKNKINLIITNRQVNKIIKDELKCDFILGKDLNIKEEKYFAIVEKHELEKQKSMKGMLNKVIDEYQKSRNPE